MFSELSLNELIKKSLSSTSLILFFAMSVRYLENSFANNWRFCMREKIKNGGTQILKELRRQAPLYWKQQYNQELKYLITFVAGGNNGAVYKADNWKMIGYTSGLPEHKSSSMKWDTNESLKNKFVKPTGENKKMIFFKKIEHNQNKNNQKSE